MRLPSRRTDFTRWPIAADIGGSNERMMNGLLIRTSTIACPTIFRSSASTYATMSGSSGNV